MMRTLKGVAGEKVTYQIYGGSAYTLTAVIGRSEFDVESISLDFIVNTEDLQQLPTRGDTITRANGVEYLVLSMGTEPQWRYTDQEEISIRIHAVRRD
jgi:hypothetical protein